MLELRQQFGILYGWAKLSASDLKILSDNNNENKNSKPNSETKR